MSDSDTTDSDSGIRFKTTSTRYKSERTDKYSSSSKSRRSLDSSGRRSRDRDRGRDRRRSSTDRRTDRRSKHSASRSKSRSRSRERRKRRERDRERRRRSRSRSRSKRSSQSRRDRESSPENKITTTTSIAVTPEAKETSTAAEQSKIEPGKILDISVSSLSSQDDHIGKDETPEDHFGPALPPAPPSPAKESTNNESPSKEEKTDEIIGPALPPHLISQQQEVDDPADDNSTRVIGPTLPTDFKPATEATTAASSESELSPFSEEEPEADDDDLIGPMPGASSSRSHLELEQRALEMKIRRFDAERYDPQAANATTREDWMLELPDIRKVSDLGLGARQFRTREKLEIGDRTVWTDTPTDKERKKSGQSTSKDPAQDREAEQERRRVADRDKQQDELIKRHKKKHKRDKTLLEIHQKKLKKEKEKKEKSDEPTRRPFDRNVDLHANQFDEAQKKAIYKKAQLLDTRFSGGASKFL